MCRVESSLIDGAPITKKVKPTGDRDIRRCCALGPFSGHFLSFICGRAASAKSLAVLKSATSFSSSARRSEEHTSELQSLMRISYAVFCLKKKKQQQT